MVADSNNSKESKEPDHLTKAKDSRDEVAQNIKEIEEKIENMTKKPTQEPNESEKSKEIFLDELSKKIENAKNDLNEIVKLIEDRKAILKSIEAKIVVQTDINMQQSKDRDAISEEIAVLRKNKVDLEKSIEENHKKDENLSNQIHSKEMEITVITGDIKSKSKLLENLLKNTEDLEKNTSEQRKIIEINKKELEELETKKTNRQNEIDFLNKKLTQIKEDHEQISLFITEKEIEVKKLKDHAEEFRQIITQKEEMLKKLQDDILSKQKDMELKDDLIRNHQDRLHDVMLKQSEYELHLNDLKASIEKTKEEKNNLDELIKNKEMNLKELQTRTERLSIENERLQAKLSSAQVNLEKIQKEHDSLRSTNEVIEKNINESKKHIQNLKNSLESQEKVIREKESRLHRIEVLSFFYKISKLFGGILMLLGLFYLLFGLGYAFNLLDFALINHQIIIYISIIGAVFLLISGIFQLEKL